MKRLRRWLFNGLTALSLLLGLATVALWVRSYIVSDILNHKESTWGLDVRSGMGFINVGFERGSNLNPQNIWLHDNYSAIRRQVWSKNYSTKQHESWDRGIGIGAFYIAIERPPYLPSSVFYQGGMPHWFMAILFLILPIAWVTKNRRARKENRIGLCQSCGYDLRATPNRCPECGTAPKKTATISN